MSVKRSVLPGSFASTRPRSPVRVAHSIPMSDSPASRRLVRNQDLNELLFRAVDRALTIYERRLDAGTLIRVRAAVVREVLYRLRTGGELMPDEEPAFLLVAQKPKPVEDARADEGDDLDRELEQELARTRSPRRNRRSA